MFKEDVGIGYMVGSVTAFDNDADVNKELRYSLLPGCKSYLSRWRRFNTSLSRSGASEASERSVAEHLCYPACVLLVVSKFRTRTYVSKMSEKVSVKVSGKVSVKVSIKIFFLRFVTYDVHSVASE